MNVRVNRWLDFLDRVGWTAIYGIASAVIIAFDSDALLSWQTAAKLVGLQVAMAVVKVLSAQRVGDNDLGAAVPGQVIEGVSPARPIE